MKINKLLTSAGIISLIVIIALLLPGCTKPAPAPTTTAPAPTTTTTTATATKLRITTRWLAPTVAYQSEMCKAWMDAVTQRTNGLITWDDSWAGALGSSGAELATKLETGVVDALLAGQPDNPSSFPLSNIEYTYAFGPSDPALLLKSVRMFNQEFTKYIDRDLAARNQKHIAQFMSPPYVIMSLKPIAKLADFNGLKIGAYGTYLGQWFPPAGAVPVSSTSGERYEMLRNNLIQGTVLPTIEQVQAKSQEQCKYLIDIPLFSHFAWEVVISLKVFNSLPANIQKIMVDTGFEMEDKAVTTYLPKWETLTRDTFQKAGVQTVNFPQADIDKWASTIPDIPAQFAQELEGKGYPGFDIVKRWQEINTANGFKWARQWGIKK